MVETTEQPSAVEKARAIQEAQREAYRKEFLERDAHREGEHDYTWRGLEHDGPAFRTVSFMVYRWHWATYPNGSGKWVRQDVVWVFGVGYIPEPEHWERSHKLAADACAAYDRGEDPTRWPQYDPRRKVLVAVSDDEVREILRRQHGR